MNLDDARNANMVKLAYFQQEQRELAQQLETIITRASDLIDAQTIVDTIQVALDELTYHYRAAVRARDAFRRQDVPVIQLQDVRR